MTHPNKVKGNNFERELVNQARERGLSAERAYASNGRSLGEVEGVDLIVGGVRVQAKRHKKMLEYLQIDEGVDCVVFREDRGKSFAMIRWDYLLDMIEGEKHA